MLIGKMDRKGRFIFLDKYKRKNFVKSEIKKKIISRNISPNILVLSMFSEFYKSKVSLIRSRSRIRNRCFVTGRSYSIMKNLKVSRFVLRKDVYLNSKMGFRKF